MKSSEEAYQSFLNLRAEAANYELEFQTEADTRARLISRIIHDVLDWPQQNVKREDYANPGFMDYLLLTNKPIIVVEAKKSGDTFDLPSDATTKKLFTLNGVIRTIKNLAAHIDQVCQYCWHNGVEYAVITNGPQWVAFKAFTDGIHVGQGRVILFNSLDDIADRFAEFWSLLAKVQVENNSLHRAFQPSDAHVFQYTRIADLNRRKERISRNLLSPDITRVQNSNYSERPDLLVLN